MVYILPADFRAGTAQDYSTDLQLSYTDASDAQLTAAIARQGLRFDFETDDHFETETGITVKLDGHWCQRIYVSKRIQSITTVQIRSWGGAYVTQTDATAYEVVSSLSAPEPTTADDFIEVVPVKVLANGYQERPGGAAAVKLTGNFSWTAPPEDVKRAVAIMVWDGFRDVNPDLRRATRFQTPDANIEIAPTAPTGLVEVDMIIGKYRRSSVLAV